MLGIKSAEEKPPEKTSKKVGQSNSKQYRTMKASASSVTSKSEKTQTVSVSAVKNQKSELSDLNVAEWLTYDVIQI